MHVVRGSIVLNPHTFDLLDIPIEGCLEAECKSTED